MTQPVAAERIRAALIEAARRAYEDAGVRGLCAEGRWEAALDAMSSLDLASAREAPPPPAPGR